MTDFSPIVQLWFNTVLVWIGFGTVAGLMANALLPKGKPEGLYGVLVVGICGSCAGVFLLDYAAKYANIYEFSEINPISSVGLFVSIIASIVILLCYRFVLLIAYYFKKKPVNNTAHNLKQTQITQPTSQQSADSTKITENLRT
ncbi:MAG: GlsB/YeaQ/YmgE family stress response membrane protein [Planctomycetaceae bacterium]|jgi:uncharacterized membrane protein YeaQ/YmgE (transglycosylase-associated protein family)|nr:GlsB/YeaQ/YmgE family stress response membrane protein [Planctomycetaceae bacterium]